MVKFVIDAKELMECGPFSERRRKTLVFTLGNDFEWHGPALPPDTDSRTTWAIASRFTERSGATLAAHIPFTSDRIGDIAKDWCPIYLPWEEFKWKTIGFITDFVNKWPGSPKEIVILMGHGGLRPLIEQADDIEKATHIKTTVIFVPDLGSKYVKLPEDFEGTDTLKEIMSGRGEHAYIMEHSLAAYLGFMDWEALEMINQMAARDTGEVLKKWPVLAGLGGYKIFRTNETDELKRSQNLFCAEDFIRRKKIPVSVEAGGAIVEAQVRELLDIVFGG